MGGQPFILNVISLQQDMGAQITAFIESRSTSTASDGTGYIDWDTIAEVFLDRDRHVFAAMTGGMWGSSKPNPALQPRGIPHDFGTGVHNSDVIMTVCHEGEPKESPDEVSAKDAEALLNKYPTLFHMRDQEGRLTEIESVLPSKKSWLLVNEFRSALASVESVEEVSSCYRAALALMEYLVEQSGLNGVRIVFWFYE